jgi:hypothetical protein
MSDIKTTSDRPAPDVLAHLHRVSYDFHVRAFGEEMARVKAASSVTWWVLMPGERLKASHIPGRDNGLMKEPVQLVEPLDAIPLFARHSLALFTDVNAMATPAELLVWT